MNLNTVATSLNSSYSTLGTLLGSRASQASVDAALALKQDLIGEGALTVAMTDGLETRLQDIRAIPVVNAGFRG